MSRHTERGRNGRSEAGASGHVRLLPEEPGLPSLCCFHFAGGSAQSFQRWVPAFRGRANLIAFELPGRGRQRSKPFAATLGEASAGFADAWPDLGPGPVTFVGHSLGALLAHETTRELRRRGLPGPDRLVLMSRQAPGTRGGSGHALPEPNREGLRTYLSRLDGTPSAILDDDAYMDMMLPVFVSDFELLRNEQPSSSAPLSCPIHLIGALDDAIISPASLLGWRSYTTASLSIDLVDGSHFAPLDHPQLVAERLAIPLQTKIRPQL